jgi:hypothetical protein
MKLLASVANKRLTAKLNPLAATLTENRGWGLASHRASTTGYSRNRRDVFNELLG